MSQRKAKEYRQAMEQYRGVVEDVDDLKRRIGAMEARHRREDKLEEIRRRMERDAMRERQEKEMARAMERAEAERSAERRRRSEKRRRQIVRQRITFLVCLAVLFVVMVLAMVAACKSVEDQRKETTPPDPVAVTPVALQAEDPGEDPLEAEKIEAALLEQGVFLRRHSPAL